MANVHTKALTDLDDASRYMHKMSKKIFKPKNNNLYN